MKLYVNKKQRNRSLIMIIPTCIIFMWLMPYGSFDPGDHGFWICIVLSLFMSFTGSLLLTKIVQKYGNGDHEVD